MDTPLAFTHFNEVINFIKLPPLGDTIFDYKIDCAHTHTANLVQTNIKFLKGERV